MIAGFHSLTRALQQLCQAFIRHPDGLCLANAHCDRNPVAPPAKISRARQSGKRLSMFSQHLRAALVRDYKKLLIAPAAHLFPRSQALR